MVDGPLYFGCVTTVGHYLWDRDIRAVRARADGVWWMERLDGLLPPQGGFDVEGEARLHVIHGWTLIAFWDRSVDSRPKSNSIFFVPGVRTSGEALFTSQEAFPTIFARFQFDVRLQGVQVRECGELVGRDPELYEQLKSRGG